MYELNQRLSMDAAGVAATYVMCDNHDIDIV